MMQTLFQRLCEHFAQTNLPVWLSDCVPANTPFPYLSLTVEPAPFGTPGRVTATVWTLNAHANRLLLADEVLALVPMCGVRIPLPTGSAMLYPIQGEKTILRREGDALGVSLSFELRVYAP